MDGNVIARLFRDVEDLSLGALLDTPNFVWTAAKTRQKRTEAPAIITTVTREQIAVWGYLRYQFTPGERTLLAGVREFPAGCHLRWRDAMPAAFWVSWCAVHR